jgi:serine/threonine protein kinase
MEYVRGQTLKEYLSGHASPAGEEARRLAGQLLEGLSAVRRAGIIHTRVAPEDVRVDNAGILKILNFGIHKAVEAGGMDAALMPFFRSQHLTPESTSGHDLDVAGLPMCGLLSGILLREPEHRPDARAPGINVGEHTLPVDSKGSPPGGQYALAAPAGRRLAADRVAMGRSGSMVATPVASAGDSAADTVRFPAISNAQSGAVGLVGVGVEVM